MTVTVLKLATSTPCITESSTARELYERVQHAVMIQCFQASKERVCSQTYSVCKSHRYHCAVC